mmetsp:Transcript_13191/g.36163  ORF Transcript_13191/g.36163 Transcript_13191/m.36163 type:complete len:284 (+) Transcript_13191:77-928(+)
MEPSLLGLHALVLVVAVRARGEVLHRVELLTRRLLHEPLQLLRLFDLPLDANLIPGLAVLLGHHPQRPRARVPGADAIRLGHVIVPRRVLVHPVGKALDVVHVLHGLLPEHLLLLVAVFAPKRAVQPRAGSLELLGDLDGLGAGVGGDLVRGVRDGHDLGGVRGGGRGSGRERDGAGDDGCESGGDARDAEERRAAVHHVPVFGFVRFVDGHAVVHLDVHVHRRGLHVALLGGAGAAPGAVRPRLGPSGGRGGLLRERGAGCRAGVNGGVVHDRLRDHLTRTC